MAFSLFSSFSSFSMARKIFFLVFERIFFSFYQLARRSHNESYIISFPSFLTIIFLETMDILIERKRMKKEEEEEERKKEEERASLLLAFFSFSFTSTSSFFHVYLISLLYHFINDPFAVHSLDLSNTSSLHPLNQLYAMIKKPILPLEDYKRHGPLFAFLYR